MEMIYNSPNYVVVEFAQLDGASAGDSKSSTSRHAARSTSRVNRPSSSAPRCGS